MARYGSASGASCCVLRLSRAALSAGLLSSAFASCLSIEQGKQLVCATDAGRVLHRANQSAVCTANCKCVSTAFIKLPSSSAVLPQASAAVSQHVQDFVRRCRRHVDVLSGSYLGPPIAKREEFVVY